MSGMLTRDEMIRAAMRDYGFDRHKAERMADLQLAPTMEQRRAVFRERTGSTTHLVRTLASRKARETDDERAWTEDQHQIRLFEWRTENLHRWPELAMLIHIPNGGHRSKATAGRLKALGVKRGVHDLLLPVPRGVWFGAWCEMKRIGGKPTDEQLEWRALMRAQGYRAEIIEGWRDTADYYERYLAS